MSTTSGATISTAVTVSSGETATSDTVVAGGTLTIQAGGVETGSTISAGGNEVISGSASGDQIYGTVTVPTNVSPTLNNETVYSGGILNLSQGFTASNIDIKAGGTLNVQGSGVTSNITLEGGGATLNAKGGRLATTGTLALSNGGNIIEFTNPVLTNLLMDSDGAVISGFSSTDKIDFTKLTYNSTNEYLTSSIDSNGNTVVSLMSSGFQDSVAGSPAGVVERFTFYSTIYGGTLSVISDGATGTEIVTSVTCYCRGTMILTGNGEVPVEKLSIGDTVITASGAARPIKWIGNRSYGGRFIIGQKDILPICVKMGAISDGVPHRDLWVSPHHALFIDGVLIEAKDLVNGVSIIQADHTEHVEYYHVELDSHDVIMAEGVAAETYVDDDNRGLFFNAHEYAALYPETTASDARYCAPRIEQGYALEEARRSLAWRAGLREPQQDIGELDGYVDFIGADRIEGWARNVRYPQAPVCLDFLVGGQLMGQTLAHLVRSDLEEAGLGSCAFAFSLPSGFEGDSNAIEIRRSLDGCRLTFSDTAHQLLEAKLSAA